MATAAKEETKVQTVTMTDGRSVDFPGKRRMQKESFVDDASGAISVRLDFINGETRTFTIPEGLVAKFAAHGAEQKLGDETAGLTDVDDAVLAIDELVERLNKGEWGVKREGNDMSGTSVLARALVEYKNTTMEKVKTFLAGKSAAEKMALRANPGLKPIIERIEAEKAAKGTKVDTDALLNELA